MKLVLVEWLDSETHRGWQRLSDLVKDGLSSCRSVGWLAVDNEDRIMLVSHLSHENEPSLETFASDAMSIPKACVLKMKTLKS